MWYRISTNNFKKTKNLPALCVSGFGVINYLFLGVHACKLHGNTCRPGLKTSKSTWKNGVIQNGTVKLHMTSKLSKARQQGIVKIHAMVVSQAQ